MNPIPSPHRAGFAGQLALHVKVVVKACTFTGVLYHALLDKPVLGLVNSMDEPEYTEPFPNHSWLGLPANPLG